MATPVVARRLEVEDVVKMWVEELTQHLDSLGQETKRLTKSQLQKLLIKFLSPIISVLEYRIKPKLEAQAEERKLGGEER